MKLSPAQQYVVEQMQNGWYLNNRTFHGSDWWLTSSLGRVEAVSESTALSLKESRVVEFAHNLGQTTRVYRLTTPYRKDQTNE